MPVAKVSVVGDVLIHDRLLKSARAADDMSFTSNFERVSESMSEADVSCANLESITAGEKYGVSGYPRFNAPTDLLTGLQRSGFRLLNVANNHMLDKGEQALLDSLANISASGMDYLGAAPDRNAAGANSIKVVDGIRIGFVSYTDGAKINASLINETHINHFPGESETSKMVRRVIRIKRSIAMLRGQVDAIVLQLHFGEEYHRFPSAFQRELVTSLSETGVDVIIGHHPHVLQPIEWIENSRGKPVLVNYSLGNFFSGQHGIHRQIGAIFSFKVKKENGLKNTNVEVVEPEIELTIVDPKQNFEIVPLRSVVKKRSELFSSGHGWLESRVLYDKVVAHARTYIDALTVR